MVGTVWDSTEELDALFQQEQQQQRQQQQQLYHCGINSLRLKHRAIRSLTTIPSSTSSQPSPPLPAPIILIPTTSEPNAANCTDINYDDYTSPCYRNETCVGAPEYCNFTREEYVNMVYEYIFPTTGEWILIVCHAVVFIVGLVSIQ